MKSLIIPIIISSILLLVWLLFLVIVALNNANEKIYYHKWTELTIAWLSFIALVTAGIFGYVKYDDYRRESNYQKVIIRYLDNNIDVFTSQLSQYATNVAINLELLLMSRGNVETLEKRKNTFFSVLSSSGKLVTSLHKLMVFDPIIYQSYIKIFNETSGSLKLIIDDPINYEKVKIQKMFIEDWSRFIIFNLQDIGELIRKNPYDYKEPIIESIKYKKEYKEIVNRFEIFINLWNDMINAKNTFEACTEKNKELELANPIMFKENSAKLEKDWNDKTANLHNYVAKYLDERGIPTAKAIVTK